MSSIHLQSAVLQVVLEHIGIFWLGSCLEDDDGTTAALEPTNADGEPSTCLNPELAAFFGGWRGTF